MKDFVRVLSKIDESVGIESKKSELMSLTMKILSEDSTMVSIMSSTDAGKRANLQERISVALSEFPKIYDEMRLTHEEQVRCARLLTEFAQTSFTAIVGDLSTAERYPSIEEIEDAVVKAIRENLIN